MHESLHRLKLFLPATFEHIHIGKAATWTSRADVGHRIDHIAVPMAWKPDPMCTRVCIELDTMADGTDHEPLTLEVRRVAPADDNYCQRRRIPYDRGKLADPARAADFLKQVRELTPIPWEWDADSHLTHINTKVTELLCEHFPKTSTPPRSPWITDTTWDLLAWRRSVYKAVRTNRKEIDMLLKRKAFRVWLAAPPDSEQDDEVDTPSAPAAAAAAAAGAQEEGGPGPRRVGAEPRRCKGAGRGEEEHPVRGSLLHRLEPVPRA